MSLTGIWTIKVAGVYGWENRGILIFCADQKHVMGGGRNHYSVGSYTKSGTKVKIALDARFHDQQVMFGKKRKNISVVLEGKWKNGKITGTVNNPKDSKESIPMCLTRLSDLP